MRECSGAADGDQLEELTKSAHTGVKAWNCDGAVSDDNPEEASGCEADAEILERQGWSEIGTAMQTKPSQNKLTAGAQETDNAQLKVDTYWAVKEEEMLWENEKKREMDM